MLDWRLKRVKITTYNLELNFTSALLGSDHVKKELVWKWC